MRKSLSLFILVVSILAYTSLYYKFKRDYYVEKLVTTNIALYNLAGEFMIKTDYSSDSVNFIKELNFTNVSIDTFYGVYLTHIENKNFKHAQKIVDYISDDFLIKIKDDV